jgi:hypothetical protein
MALAKKSGPASEPVVPNYVHQIQGCPPTQQTKSLEREADGDVAMA